MTGLAVALLRGYKRFVSPLLPPSCRFSPTCSEYAQIVLLKYGFWRGMAYTLHRVGRCHPYAAGGIDLP